MKLTFLGAAHEVTGSCHMLEACGKVILVDYGMEQGHPICSFFYHFVTFSCFFTSEELIFPQEGFMIEKNEVIIYDEGYPGSV